MELATCVTLQSKLGVRCGAGSSTAGNRLAAATCMRVGTRMRSALVQAVATLGTLDYCCYRHACEHQRSGVVQAVETLGTLDFAAIGMRVST